MDLDNANKTPDCKNHFHLQHMTFPCINNRNTNICFYTGTNSNMYPLDI